MCFGVFFCGFCLYVSGCGCGLFGFDLWVLDLRGVLVWLLNGCLLLTVLRIAGCCLVVMDLLCLWFRWLLPDCVFWDCILVFYSCFVFVL